jgi:hypothetical protein
MLLRTNYRSIGKPTTRGASPFVLLTSWIALAQVDKNGAAIANVVRFLIIIFLNNLSWLQAYKPGWLVKATTLKKCWQEKYPSIVIKEEERTNDWSNKSGSRVFISTHIVFCPNKIQTECPVRMHISFHPMPGDSLSHSRMSEHDHSKEVWQVDSSAYSETETPMTRQATAPFRPKSRCHITGNDFAGRQFDLASFWVANQQTPMF